MDDIMGGGGGKSAFSHLRNPGDMVEGMIIGDPVKKPDTDDEGNQRTFPSGDLRWLWLVPIQTELREDETDDGVRTLWLGWKSLNAFTAAVRKGWAQAGRSGKPVPEYGGYIKMWITGLERTKKGTDSKNWAAEYVPPAGTPDTVQMMDTPVEPAAPTSPAPVAPRPASPLAQTAQAQGNLLQRLKAEAEARRAGQTVPAHHSQGEAPF